MRTLPLIFCLSAVAHAQADVQSFQLKDGTVIRASIISVDKAQDNLVRYTFYAGGGSGITSQPLSNFAPHSQFNILRAVLDENDLEARVALATFAVDNGLIAAARRELNKAKEIADDQGVAPDVEARIMDEAVKALDGILRDLLDEGKVKDANVVLHQILAGKRITDAQKAQFTAMVQAKTQAVEAAAAQERAAKRTAELNAEQQRWLEPLKDRLQRGKQLEQTALQNLQNQSQALNAYEAAVQVYTSVMRDAQELTRQHSDSTDFTGEVAALSKQAENEKITCLLSMGSVYTTRSSFNQAMGMVGQVLAMDSQNQQALNMRARIEIAANSDWNTLGGNTIVSRPTGNASRPRGVIR